MPNNLTFDNTSDGVAVFDGPHKVAVVGTRHEQGLVKNGVILMEVLPREAWQVTWVRPTVSVALVQAVLDALAAVGGADGRHPAPVAH